MRSRIVLVVQHLELIKSHNASLRFVAEQKQNDIIRVKEKLLENYQTECGENTTLKTKIFIKTDIELARKKHNAKFVHGNSGKKIKQDPGINKPLSFFWKKDRFVTF